MKACLISLFLSLSISCVTLSANSDILSASMAGIEIQCLENIVGGAIYVGGIGCASNSLDTNGRWLDKSPTDYDCSQILADLSASDLTYTVVRPLDSITVGVYLWDKSGQILVSGSKTGYLQYSEKGGGGYYLPPSMRRVEVEMVSIAYLPISDPGSAQGGQINVRNANGQITFSDGLEVEDGRLGLPTKYASCYGEIIINRYEDGRYWQDWYDLRTMQLLPQSQVISRVQTLVKNYLDLGSNPYMISATVQQRQDGADNPLLKFTVDKATVIPAAGYMYDSEGQYTGMAYAVYYRMLGNDSISGVQELSANNQTLSLPVAGTYQAFFLYEGLEETRPVPSWYSETVTSTPEKGR